MDSEKISRFPAVAGVFPASGSRDPNDQLGAGSTSGSTVSGPPPHDPRQPRTQSGEPYLLSWESHRPSLATNLPRTQSPTSPPLTQAQPTGLFRSMVELSVALLILVLLFRSFLAGGYMIETGSMAPCLLGYHREARCPACQHTFPVDGTQGAGNATCPNCGTGEIPTEELLLNDGDHLLV